MKQPLKRKKQADEYVCDCCEQKLPLDDFLCEDEGWRYKLCRKCRKAIYAGRSSPSSGWYKYHTCLVIHL